MVPAGRVTELAVEEVWPELARGDVIVDGGNANYKDSQRRGAALATAGIRFVDCGVSGGVWGLDNGYALMFGGDAEAAAADRAVREDPRPGARRRLAALRPLRRRALRQDDPQRHRVRDDAGVRRGLRPAQGQDRVRHRRRRRRRDLAPRQRRPLVAARPHRRVPRRAMPSSPTSRPSSPIRAKGAGPRRRRSSRASPRR